MKAVPIPTTRAGSTPADRDRRRNRSASTASQSAGSWSAQDGGSRSSGRRQRRSITPCAYSCVAVPTVVPSVVLDDDGAAGERPEVDSDDEPAVAAGP